jgi:hypothetical protein
MNAYLLALSALIITDGSLGDLYLEAVLPGVIVFGAGMTIFVAPLTAAVLGALPDERAGIASAVNNAAARLAQLLASSALPAAAGLTRPLRSPPMRSPMLGRHEECGRIGAVLGSDRPRSAPRSCT